jgi:AcrR family transcriptional regulator
MQESILSTQNIDGAGTEDVASRIASKTLASRNADYASEVRRLLDAGREVMRERGTGGKARVADIVAAAGLSNDAFYRHFNSKDELVTAILEDGTIRLRSYIAHQMGKARSPEARVRRWVEGVLSQAMDEDVAAATLAVLWNAGGADHPRGRSSATGPLATLLVEPLSELGSEEPALDASLAAHAVVGHLTDHLLAGSRPTPAEVAHIAQKLAR